MFSPVVCVVAGIIKSLSNEMEQDDDLIYLKKKKIIIFSTEGCLNLIQAET